MKLETAAKSLESRLNYGGFEGGLKLFRLWQRHGVSEAYIYVFMCAYCKILINPAKDLHPNTHN